MNDAENEIVDKVVDETQLESANESTDLGAENQGDEAEQKRVPLAELVKQREKKQQALSEVDTLKRQVQALQQENDLKSLVIPDTQEEEAEIIAPNPNDYFDDDDWLEAQKKYNESYKKKLENDTAELVKKQLAERDQAAEQSKAERDAQLRLETTRAEYLERADKLEASDFLEREDALRKEVQPWFFDQLMANFENSEQLIYSLGGDIPKARELIEGFDKDNFRGGMDLVKYAANLGKSNTGNLPEPDEAIKGGGGVSDVEAQISRLRDQKLAGKLTMQQFMDKKRELKKSVA